MASSQLNWGFFILMKILRLTLKKKWFDMSKSRIKKEEYREIKPYWEKRFYRYGSRLHGFKEWDAIEFTNGYGKNAPRFIIKCKGIEIGFGKPEWGADPNVKCFKLLLGDIVNASEQKEQCNG